ncbi:MAG: hypothetical protein WDA00_03550 [Eubacteriales bacterium]
MYHFIEDKDFLKRMKSLCSDIVNQLVQQINGDGEMRVKANLVGSGAKNLITQNENNPIDLDYNLEIVDSGSFDINDGTGIKEYVRKQFNIVLNANEWGDCQDSTSALTTEQRIFKNGNKTPYSIDLCIIATSDDAWFRLIHEKTGYFNRDRWYWNKGRNSEKMQQKVNWLKENDLWLEVRDTYLEKKNMYLRRNDHDHSSFMIYIEAVNEVYNRH